MVGQMNSVRQDAQPKMHRQTMFAANQLLMWARPASGSGIYVVLESIYLDEHFPKSD